MRVRQATQEDCDAIWHILEPTIRTGETHALPRDMSEADALAYWIGPDRRTFVAGQDGQIVGTIICAPISSAEVRTLRTVLI